MEIRKIGRVDAIFVRRTTLIIVPVISSAISCKDCSRPLNFRLRVRSISSVAAAVTVTDTSITAPRQPMITWAKKKCLASVTVNGSGRKCRKS